MTENKTDLTFSPNQFIMQDLIKMGMDVCVFIYTSENIRSCK